MAATDEYLENQVLTASAHQLHLMVVEGAMRFSRQGLAAMADEGWEAVRWSLTRARNCMTDLIGAIKSDSSPVLAEQTKLLFLNVYWNFSVAEIERNPQRIHDGLRILQMHRETWVELGGHLQANSLTSGPKGTLNRSPVPEPHLSGSRSWVT